MSRMPVVVLVAVLSVVSPGAEGEVPVLVADLKLDPAPTGVHTTAQRRASPVDFLGRTYFTYRDDQHGRELWVSDGTAAGTSIFLDLCSGPCSSDPGPLVVAGDRLFFFADDRISGPELWATDGTLAGTVLVEDFCPGDCGWHRVQSVALGSRLVFVGEQSLGLTNQLSLASSDGTAEGTFLLSEYRQDGLDPHLITRHGDVVLFGFGGVLWSTDGTREGTVPVSDLRTPSGPNGLATLGNRTFFTRLASLFVTDGTDAGTTNLRFLNPDVEALGSSQVMVGRAENFVDLDGTVYFLVAAFARGSGERICTLWRSDGSVAGTGLVTRLLPAGRTRCPLGLVAHRGRLYFDFVTRPAGEELWVSDGTAEGTRSLGVQLRSYVDQARPLGDLLYFDGPQGVWRTDGTPEGTLLPGFLEGKGLAGRFGGRLFLQESSADGARVVFSTSDGTAEGTVPFTSAGQRLSSSHPEVLTDFAGRVYFTATDDEGEKVRTVGAVDPFDMEILLEDDDGDLFGHTAPEAAVFGALLAINVDGLVVSDGSAASVSILGRGLVGATGLTPVGDHLYFAGVTDAESSEPWLSDGSEAGTRLVRDIVPGGDFCCIAPPIIGGSHPSDFIPLGERLLFVAEGELWSSDGSVDGTFQVADILPWASARLSDLTLSGPWVLFAATGPDFGRELWRSDGTPAGTLRVADLEAGQASSHPSGLTAFGGLVYFATGNPESHARLWASDGTSAGTVLILDLAVSGAARIEDLTVVGRQLFFVATRSSTGRELWVSDGTEQGTRQVRDLFPGAASSNPRSLTASNDGLLFSANDGQTGVELWLSDGTSAGTRLLTDLDPGPRSSLPGSLHVVGPRVFFAAATESQGRELWGLFLTDLFTDGFESGDMSAWSSIAVE